MNMIKKIPWLLIFVLMLGLGQTAFSMQKILVIVEDSTYSNIYMHVYRYVNEIMAYDYKKAESIIWHIGEGNNYMQCKPLWDTLQQRYFSALNEGDFLEGAVLIGNIPVPQQAPQTGYLPIDQVYMDIVDMTTGQPQQYSPNEPPFGRDYGGYFTRYYGAPGYPAGDKKLDIWISRINAQYLNGGIRQGAYSNDERQIYLNYLDRMHTRMTEPATVPSRGFAMGGPVDGSCNLHDGLGVHFLPLNLSWFAEFTSGHNSSFNWMSQLLAGPRGCINFGACNGTLFPSERNRRYCRYYHLNIVYLPGGNLAPYGKDVFEWDSLGWEWAGAFGHSMPDHTQFHGNENGDGFYNGQFSFGTLGPYWASQSSAYWVDTAGYNGGYYWYEDNDTNPNPYNRGHGWKEKACKWRWNVTANNNYDIYVYYEAPIYPDSNLNNCNYVEYYLYKMSLGADGTPQSPLGHYIYDEGQGDSVWIWYWSVSIDQRTHINYLASNPKWERIFSGMDLQNGYMAIINMLAARGYHRLAPGGYITGHQIADAVRFRVQGVVDTAIDDAQPNSYPDTLDAPFPIFRAGFYTDDEVNRAYEDMGDEPGGGGYSKSQFFLNTACQINNYLYTTPLLTQSTPEDDPNMYDGTAIVKNIGNLYALGHNGLVCMGATTKDMGLFDKSIYTNNLNNGKDFGEAFLAYQNAYFVVDDPSHKIITEFFSLLGAGSLRAHPYVQYGSDIEQDRTITTTENISLYQPILIKNVTVNGNGNWHVTSNYDFSYSPPGTHSEIIIRPETHFAPTGTNEVHLIVN